MIKVIEFSEGNRITKEKESFVAIFDDLIVTETSVIEYIKETFNPNIPETYRKIVKNKSDNNQVLIIMKKIDYNFLQSTISANYEMSEKKIPFYTNFVLSTREQMNKIEKAQKEEIEEQKKKIPKELLIIVNNKIKERENAGYDYLTDSDIMDILEESERQNLKVTRKMLHYLNIY